jgi:hypothetical protein
MKMTTARTTNIQSNTEEFVGLRMSFTDVAGTAQYKGSRAVVASSPIVRMLTEQLIKSGIMPTECTHFELMIDADKPVTVTSTRNVSQQDIERLVGELEQEA